MNITESKKNVVAAFAMLLIMVFSLFAGCSSMGERSGGKTKFPFSSGPDDGRFTLGVKGVRLMYGYPIPISTSHFVIRIEDETAANTTAFARYPVTYISSEREEKTIDGIPVVEVEYLFHECRIIQRLIPVDSDLNAVANNQGIKYYQIKYIVKNLRETSQRFNLKLLIDTMIGENDAAPFYVDGRRVTTERGFYGNRVPDSIRVYQEPGNTKKVIGELLTKNSIEAKPDSVYVGSWPRFFGVYKNVNPTGAGYGDSAIISEWDDVLVPGNGSKTLSVYYGMANRNIPENIEVFYNERNRKSAGFVFSDYDSDQYNVSMGQKLTFQYALYKYLVENNYNLNNVIGVILEGHADAQGPEWLNQVLAKRRALAVRDYLVGLGFKEDMIIAKGYGEDRARQTEQAKQKGRASDRKVVLKLYIKE